MKVTKGFLIILLLFTFINLRSQSQTNLNLYYKNLYNFTFNVADSLLMIIRRSGIDNASKFNLRAYYDWWKLLSGDSSNIYLDLCRQHLNESVRCCKANLILSPADSLNLIMSYSLRARLEVSQGNELKGVYYFMKANEYIKGFEDSALTDDKARLLNGLFLYFKGYLNLHYNFLNSLIEYDYTDDLSNGIKYLEICSESSDIIVQTEAIYFLYKIFFYLKKDPENSLQYLDRLIVIYPLNLIFLAERLKLLRDLGLIDKLKLKKMEMLVVIKDSGELNTLQKNHFINIVNSISTK